MTKFNDFDLDIQNTKGSSVSVNATGYSVLSCPTQPIIDCAIGISEAVCPTENRGCVPETQQTCYTGNCHDGTLKMCPANIIFNNK